jgi:hypothetical protein
MMRMANEPDAGNVDRFIVAPRDGGDTGQLADFENALKAFPDAEVVKRGGRPEQPLLVVTLKPDSFKELQSRFGASLIMERDAPLSPL